MANGWCLDQENVGVVGCRSCLDSVLEKRCGCPGKSWGDGGIYTFWMARSIEFVKYVESRKSALDIKEVLFLIGFVSKTMQWNRCKTRIKVIVSESLC